MRIPKAYILITLALMIVSVGCQQHKQEANNGAFAKANVTTNEDGTYDLDAIRESGELIIATIGSPETYYEYHGVPMGLHYALAENFAEREGLHVRIELANDTAALVQLLTNGEADIIAYPLPTSIIEDTEHLSTAGYSDSKSKTSWAIRKGLPILAEALDQWASKEIIVTVNQEERLRMSRRTMVTRRTQAVYLSRERGIISPYDGLFREAATSTGWDWRLIAAQCYQESGFDPNARSWVGAQGLMQIMPKTAKQLGLDEQHILDPRSNIAAAARYIRMLDKSFSDIRRADERCCFVLAAYNGGSMHIRDAMALARKYGRDTQSWASVAPFVLALQKPQYYRDPVVKHGYMIGSETYNYVNAIMKRWKEYGGTPSALLPPGAEMAIPDAATAGSATPGQSDHRPHQTNRFTRGHSEIKSPDDPEFNQMEK